MIKWLCRISPYKMAQDALFEARRDLHFTELTLEQARFVVSHHEARVKMLKERIDRLARGQNDEV